MPCRASERKRRQLYRGDVHGQLPFDTRGMEDPVPTIDFSPTGPLDMPYSLERPDIDGRTDNNGAFQSDADGGGQISCMYWTTWNTSQKLQKTQLH